LSKIIIPHLLVDAFECDGPLNDLEVIGAAMLAGADAVSAKVVGQAECRYVPHGVTAVLFLAESHILVSTWPENKTALIDVMLCNDDMDPVVVADVVLNALGAGRSASTQVSRSVTTEVDG
jgi:S-adenosylmethionine decarboxylase